MKMNMHDMSIFMDYIFKLANNKCDTCQIECKIPHKKIKNLYYCSKKCYNHF